MAYLVHKPNGTWEIRESARTSEGPRARTLASFRTLDEETAQRAAKRSQADTDKREIRALARRAGAPLEVPAAERDALSLLRSLSRRETMRAPLRDLVVQSLSEPREEVPEWIWATQEERGRDLRELLLLTDYLPAVDTSTGPSFPRLVKHADG